MSAPVEVSRDGDVLRIVLARPEKKNALTGAMYDTMRAALESADAGNDVRVILIEGSGGAFTAGNDLNDFLTYKGDFGMSPALRFVRAIAACETPIVIAVDGVAVGVGVTMLLHADLIYATPAARFRMPFIDLGVVPEAAATLLLPARIGHARAAELLMLGEPFDAERALELGLVNAVVPADDLAAVALAKARSLAAKPRNALRETRRLMRGDTAPVAERIETEARLFAQALRSPEAFAAMTAFLGGKAKG